MSYLTEVFKTDRWKTLDHKGRDFSSLPEEVKDQLLSDIDNMCFWLTIEDEDMVKGAYHQGSRIHTLLGKILRKQV
jgi:hypothetical protein